MFYGRAAMHRDVNVPNRVDRGGCMLCVYITASPSYTVRG